MGFASQHQGEIVLGESGYTALVRSLCKDKSIPDIACHDKGTFVVQKMVSQLSLLACRKQLFSEGSSTSLPSGLPLVQCRHIASPRPGICSLPGPVTGHEISRGLVHKLAAIACSFICCAGSLHRGFNRAQAGHGLDPRESGE